MTSDNDKVISDVIAGLLKPEGAGDYGPSIFWQSLYESLATIPVKKTQYTSKFSLKSHETYISSKSVKLWKL